MTEKNSSSQKVLELSRIIKKREEAKKNAPKEIHQLTDDEINYTIKLNSIEGLIEVIDTMMQELCELEEKVRKKEISPELIALLTNWDFFKEEFDDFFEAWQPMQ